MLNHFKGRIRYWLTFNEINNMSTMPWNAGGISVSGNEEDKMIAAYNQFIASAQVVKLAHEIDENNQVGMMYNGHFSYPNSSHPDDIQGNEAFQKLMLFYADVQVRGRYPNYKVKRIRTAKYYLTSIRR